MPTIAAYIFDLPHSRLAVVWPFQWNVFYRFSMICGFWTVSPATLEALPFCVNPRRFCVCARSAACGLTATYGGIAIACNSNKTTLNYTQSTTTTTTDFLPVHPAVLSLNRCCSFLVCSVRAFVFVYLCEFVYVHMYMHVCVCGLPPTVYHFYRSSLECNPLHILFNLCYQKFVVIVVVVVTVLEIKRLRDTFACPNSVAPFIAASAFIFSYTYCRLRSRCLDGGIEVRWTELRVSYRQLLLLQ